MSRWTFLACVLLAPSLAAQDLALEYRLGGVHVTEDATTLSIHVPDVPAVQLLPGGRTWPRITLDEDGNLYVGATVIDTRRAAVSAKAAGRDAAVALPGRSRVFVDRRGFRVDDGDQACLFTQRHFGLNGGKTNVQAFKDGDVRFDASGRTILALAIRFAQSPDSDTYAVASMDLSTCWVSRADLGPAGPRVELGHSRRGGWWVSGTSAGLLRSRDGRSWDRVPLPPGMWPLFSAYIANDREIWAIAAPAGSRDGDGPVIRSSDSGAQWSIVAARDTAMARMPPAWLDGLRRAARSSGGRLVAR